MPVWWNEWLEDINQVDTGFVTKVSLKLIYEIPLIFDKFKRHLAVEAILVIQKKLKILN